MKTTINYTKPVNPPVESITFENFTTGGKDLLVSQDSSGKAFSTLLKISLGCQSVSVNRSHLKEMCKVLLKELFNAGDTHDELKGKWYVMNPSVANSPSDGKIWYGGTCSGLKMFAYNFSEATAMTKAEAMDLASDPYNPERRAVFIPHSSQLKEAIDTMVSYNLKDVL